MTQHPAFRIDPAIVYVKPGRMSFRFYRKRFRIDMSMTQVVTGGRMHRRTPLDAADCGVGASMSLIASRLFKSGGESVEVRGPSVSMTVTRRLSVGGGNVAVRAGGMTIVRRLRMKVEPAAYVHQCRCSLYRRYRLAITADRVSWVGSVGRFSHGWHIAGADVTIGGGKINSPAAPSLETSSSQRFPAPVMTFWATAEPVTIAGGRIAPGIIAGPIAIPVAYRGNNWGEITGARLFMTANAGRNTVLRLHLFQLVPGQDVSIGSDGYVGSIEFGNSPAMTSGDTDVFHASCSVGFDFRDRNVNKKLYGLLESSALYIANSEEKITASLDVCL